MSFFACSFFGHREIDMTNELREKIKAQLIDLIEHRSASVFFFGGFGDFDNLCWRVVTELKQKYIFIKRVFCLSDPRHLRAHKRPQWLKDEDYEEFIYLDLEFDYWYSRIYYRNCEIIERSDFVIFYVSNTQNSGAYKVLQYAQRKKKEFSNIVSVLSHNV